MEVGPSSPATSLTMHERFPATLESVGLARRTVRRFAAPFEVDLDGVVLAVSEAVANAVAHAYADGPRGDVELSATVAPFELTVKVSDNGQGLVAGNLHPGAGFGLTIIRRVAQHVDLADTPAGVTVTMTFRRGGAWSGR